MLASLVFGCPGLDWSPIDHLETFAGTQAVTIGDWQAGRKAVPFEINMDPSTMDILTDAGFANAVYYTLRTRVGGASLHAPVCSTWVFMSRGSTLRSKSQPLGRPDSLKVQEGNVMTARVMVLCVLAAATASWWVVEQPSSSIMEYHPTFQKTLALLRGVRKLSICMANYGGESRKGTYLYSSHRCIDSLLDERSSPQLQEGSAPEMTIKYRDGAGKWRCKGGKDLKKSQHYPLKFGKALAKIRSKHRRQVRKAARQFLKEAVATENSLDTRVKINGHWLKHANLTPVLQFLSSVQ
ncbi:Putative rhamnose biosynthetic enzyme 1 [Durusdinium trenchii]|uniref:Rhamnose biosynthetic enzyme 1 n=1 Tax=Durusdinium trenchii TaxID=1381693 RepID=A0ABP0I9R0_9DINO